MIFFKKHIKVTATVTTQKGERSVWHRVKMTHKTHEFMLRTRNGDVRVKIELS